jgi:trans-AT polyketide synthase/acyltransferase/oxidoreductase domain-containing protein
MKNAILFPGQGSQYNGMGKDLFSKYNTLVWEASEILGYSVEELCINNPDGKLHLTQYTQPALFVVNALSYLELTTPEQVPDFFLGHSLGEYNALFSAGSFDFATGLKLVQERGRLMSQAKEGRMVAVLGLHLTEIINILHQEELGSIDIANYNSPDQIILSGSRLEIDKAIPILERYKTYCIPLNVSSAFHSRLMKSVETQFGLYLENFEFKTPIVSVISNVTAAPYNTENIIENMTRQISSAVDWVGSISYILKNNAEVTFTEVHGSILTKMVDKIKLYHNKGELEAVQLSKPTQKKELSQPTITIGNKNFSEKYSIKYPYVVGSMYRGISSKEMVVKMGQSNLIAYLGTGGMLLENIGEDIDYILSNLKSKQSFGVNLLYNFNDSTLESSTIDLLLEKKVTKIEASAYIKITKPIVKFRVSGFRMENNIVIQDHHIMAKCSRTEIAEKFMSPAPSKIVDELLKEGHITAEQAAIAKIMPMSCDICIEADSGGHTDQSLPGVLFPVFKMVRKKMQETYKYKAPVFLGLAGGIGSPEAIVASFVLGADFVLTGSINQCTPEANQSELVKDMLQNMSTNDTDYAPAGDMFEIGAKIQVLKKGVFFPAKANYLYLLYTHYNSLDELPDAVIERLENQYFKNKIGKIWEDVKAFFIKRELEILIDKANKDAKFKMSLVFRWYYGYSSKIAQQGIEANKVDFQIHTGPALGVFNEWVKNTELENWQSRNVNVIADALMLEAQSYYNSLLSN